VYAVQIERLRKEGSRLVAEEQEKLQQQLRDEASQLYNDADTGVRLRVSKAVYLLLAYMTAIRVTHLIEQI